jgi:molecular chaperone GrpE
MASDSTAGGAPDDMPVDSPETTPELTLETLQRVIEGLQTENADLNDKYLRAVADSHNIRRRAQQDIEKERKFGVERFARDVLSVADNLGRALSALPADLAALDPAVRNVIVGVQATDRELQSILERHGVTRIEAKGRPFNAEFHQAMMEIEDASMPAGTVVQELIPGYLLAGRLLRAAMVSVSKGGPQRTAEPKAEASNENNEA